MNNTPLVSVFMVTYNHEKYIRQSIESVLKQKTEFQFQLIIGEDFSTDGTREIVKQYSKEYPETIKAILNPKNLGAQRNSRNVFEECAGKYIALLEGDDYWIDPYKLKKQVDFLEANPEYCLVHSDYNILIDKKKRIYHSKNRKKNKIIHTGEIFEFLLINNTIATLTVCARADVLKKAADFELFEKKGFLLGDFHLWLGMSRFGKIHYIDEPMATYRVLEESAVHSKDPKKMMKIIKSDYEQRSYFVEKYGCSGDTKRIVDYNYNKSLLKYAFLLRDKKLGELTYNNLLNNKKLKDKIYIKQKLFYYASRNVFNWYVVCLFRKIKRIFKN